MGVNVEEVSVSAEFSVSFLSNNSWTSDILYLFHHNCVVRRIPSIAFGIFSPEFTGILRRTKFLGQCGSFVNNITVTFISEKLVHCQVEL